MSINTPNFDHTILDRSDLMRTWLPVAQLVIWVEANTNMLTGYFQKLSWVDILRVLFYIPKEEILPLIHQDEAKAKEYALAAYALFQEKHKDDIHSLSSKMTRDHSLGLDVLKKQIFDGVTFTEYALRYSKSATAISAMSNKAQVFLSRHWEEFRECLLVVTDPYYDTIYSSESKYAK